MRRKSNVVRVVLAVVLSLSVTQAWAESKRICSQSVEYRIMPPANDVAPEFARFSGIWEGATQYSTRESRCYALIIESVAANGAVRTKYVYYRSPDGNIINTKPSFGSGPWSGKITDGTLRLQSPDANLELRLVAPQRLEGTHYYPANNNRYPVWLVK
jgi:hypothetical protein